MWRWTLTYGAETKNLQPFGFDAPIDYKNLGLTVEKSDFNNFVLEFTEKVGFTGEIKTWILGLIETNGLDIDIDCTISKKKLSTQAFETPFTGKLNLTDIIEDRERITVNLQQTGFEIKLNNRKGTKLEINSKFTVDGSTVFEPTSVFEDISLTGVGGSTTVKGMYPWELLSRLLNKLTDTTYAVLKSTLFGRTDLTANGYADNYAIDGDFSLIMVSKGLLVSGQDPNGTTTKETGKTDINTSLSEILQAFNNIKRIGVQVQKIGGAKYVIIEELDFFFENSQYTEVITKGNIDEVVKEVATEFHYSEISNGFAIKSNDSETGLLDYSGKVVYTTPLNNFNNTDEQFSQISISPADIETARANPVSGRSEDNQEFPTDEVLFMIDCYRDGATITSRDNLVGWSSVDTSSIYGTNKLYTNLRIRPTANIYNHGRWWRIGLGSTGELRFQDSEKLSKAKTQWGGNSYEVEDGTNIDIADTKAPIITKYKYNLRAKVSSTFFTEFLSNKNMYLKFWDTTKDEFNYIWINKFLSNLVDNEVEISGYELVDVTTLDSGFVLQENGDFFLLESGDKFLLEAS